MKPLKRFLSLDDAEKLKQIAKKTFLAALVERFPNVATVDAFFTNPKSRDFFAILEVAPAPSKSDIKSKPIEKRVREMLEGILANPKGQDDEEEGDTFIFENGRVLAGVSDHKAPLSVFRRWLSRNASQKPNSQCDRFARFLAGYGVDLFAKDDSTILPSALLMLSGQQKLFSLILDIPRLTDLTAVEETLKGPWKRLDPGSPLGLDPERLQSHATSAMDPSKSGQRRTSLAVWLAVEALPLFPVIPVSHNAAHTPCFDRAETHARGMKFVWPLWTAPLALFSVSTLIAQMSNLTQPGENEQEYNENCLDELKQRGISAFFCCEKEQNGKYFNFLPARRIA